MDTIDRLLEHDHWATAVLLDVCRGLPDAKLDQPFDIGLRTLRATFGHMIFNIEFWTALMIGRPIAEDEGSHSLTELIEVHERGYAAFAKLVRQLRDEQRLSDTFVDHYAVRKSFDSTVLQVVLHNTEHRSEVVHILNRLDVPNVPEVDPGVWEYYSLNS